MKNKTYLKNHRKKSIASLFLAFLLTFSFNASPISLIFNSFGSADAYKSSSTKTYLTDSTKDTEGKFDENYITSLKEYFDGSSSSFNVLTYYNSEFESNYKEIVEGFFASKFKNDNDYEEFLKHYGVDDEKYPLYAFYSEQKNSNVLTTRLETVTYQKVIEYLAINGLSGYTDGKNVSAVVPNDLDGTVKKLSVFYRYLRNYIDDTTNTNFDRNDTYKNDDQEGGANYELLESAFYTANTHYKSIKEHIEAKIIQKAPAYIFDNETQDANIAAIFANGAPTEINYTYKKDSSGNFIYESETKPSLTYETSSVTVGSEKQTHNVIYYFGAKSDIANETGYTNFASFFKTADDGISKSQSDIFNYFLLTKAGQEGYIDSTHPTYYKITTGTPFVTSSSKISVYVLNDNPTQNALDTYESIYFNAITSDDLKDDYYVNVPYESDKLYFKAIYSNLIYSQNGFTFEQFEDYFTNSGSSLLYFKINKTTDYNVIYLSDTDLNSLKNINGVNVYDAYIKDGYTIKSFTTSEFKAEDYEEITTSGANSSYIKDEVKNSSIKLYFKKSIEYYNEETTNKYYDDKFETSKSPIVELEKHTIASAQYEPVSNTDSTRKIYVLLKTETNGTSYEVITQETLNNNPNYFVAVPDYVYTDNNIDKESYVLYYKHTDVEVNKIYVVDDSDTASESKIYQTLNYTPVKSSELSNNYTNYLSVKEEDSNYNKNFKLYYKYDRTAQNGTDAQIYILESKNFNVTATTKYNKTVTTKQLTDYIEIDKTTKINGEDKLLYEAVYETLQSPVSGGELNKENILEELRLFYKLSDVFVQNEIINRNAIYVVDSSLSTSDKESYTENMFTAITKTELENNPNLYVKIESNNPFYNSEDITYYYKYKESAPKNIVYSILDIDTTSSSFDANAYKLITDTSDPNHEDGNELYYKKLLKETTTTHSDKINTYYYLKTSTTVTLSANSYYAISFYVKTIGDKTQASFGLKDTAKMLSDINLNNLSTNGEWHKYYIFIATNASTASTINLYLYLGDEVNGIRGTNNSSEFTTDGFTGSVFFDDINITKIGLTDFNKKYIDNLPVRYAETTSEGETASSSVTKYYDNNDSTKKYKNQTFIANEDGFTNVYDARNYIDNSIKTFGTSSTTGWNGMFGFDNASDELKTLLGYESSSHNSETNNVNKSNTLSISDDTYGSDMYPSSELWKYYLDRTLDSSDFNIAKYRKAYQDGKLITSITNIIDEPEEKKSDDEDKDDDNDDDEDVSDITYVSSPFSETNYALKLKNTHKDISLGITSNSFKIEQFGYYQISLWIYSPDLDGTASISVNSVIKDISKPINGTLLTSSVSSVNANIENSSSSSSEYGWIPVNLYIEGNNYDDMDCYLVLSAGKNSTVYFDDIRIQKITSAQYDTASSNTSSNKYSCVLSLTPSSSIKSTDIKNGTFDYVKETELTHNPEVPYGADNWTAMSTNSTRVTAGVVSMLNQDAFFTKYAGTTSGETNKPVDGSNNYANVYAIYAPNKVKAIDGTTEIDYKHNYSIYSGSTSLSSSTIYKITFKFYKTSSFTGNLISNLYLSSVKTENIVSKMSIDGSTIEDDWQTYTYYISTSTSSSTAYIEIGVENATGLSYFKDVAIEKITTKTMNEILAEVAKENNIDESNTKDFYSKINNVKFVDLSDSNFGNHSIANNEETGLFDQKTFTDKTETTIDNTSGTAGITSASYFNAVNNTTYSVTINKVTYYIGEIYTVKINSKDYFVHKTYNARDNKFEYTVYSDSELTAEVTKIGDDKVEVEVSGSTVTVKVGEISYTTETTYRLYKYSDLREEVKTIDGANVTVPSLDKVVLGSGTTANENTSTTTLNTSYKYSFNGTSADKDITINNTIIKYKELNNAQSADVLILANSYSTDYISLVQSSTKTVGKSAYKVLRVYVKTSDFTKDNFGLNIEIEAINVKWENINTTNSEYADEYGFVCYEALIKTNSTDSVADVAVKLSLGEKDNLGDGYAIISKISLDTISSADEFEHYLKLVEDNETVKTAIYEETASSDEEEEEEADDKNSVSWATFFYIFSSVLLVITMAIAGVAIFIKKHPAKFAKKFENDHDRDIELIKQTKTKSKSVKNNDVVLGGIKDIKETKKDKDNSGII